MRTLKKSLILVFLCTVAGCAGSGNSDEPIGRSLGWFNFLNGTDLRRNCGKDGVDRYRFVYNGRWGEQVRIYEITRLGRARAPAEMSVRVLGPDYINVLSTDDLLQPWRGTKSGDVLSPGEMARLEAALAASGFDEPAPRGLVLPSDGFYWVAAACRDGNFHFNAWNAPSDRFARLGFPAVLLEHDRSDVKFNAPRPVPTRFQMTTGPGRGGRIYPDYTFFDLEVGDNGLKGIGALF
jgi:hypothetical protein